VDDVDVTVVQRGEGGLRAGHDPREQDRIGEGRRAGIRVVGVDE
jgi:hypothetical protein